MTEQLTLFAEEPHAKVSALPDSAKDLQTRAETSCLSFLEWLINIGQDGWYGRTCPESVAPDNDGILAPSSEGWRNSGMGGPTGALTLNTSVWHSDANVCLLSDVLEENGSVPQRFYLSPRACRGILRRAGKRGKELPTTLRRALEAVAGNLSEPEKPEDRIV